MEPFGRSGVDIDGEGGGIDLLSEYFSPYTIRLKCHGPPIKKVLGNAFFMNGMELLG
ncbi:MAG: hypothetical protein CM15mP123_13010 [Gammaproteobacteria bacterium]|nr:MAG: hypothetical protein CM15mP123_13010 [Gammaproteobacteria bacterium]